LIFAFYYTNWGRRLTKEMKEGRGEKEPRVARHGALCRKANVGRRKGEEGIPNRLKTQSVDQFTGKEAAYLTGGRERTPAFLKPRIGKKGKVTQSLGTSP